MLRVVDMKTGKVIRITAKEWWAEGGPKDNKRYTTDLTWKKKRATKKKVTKTEE